MKLLRLRMADHLVTIDEEEWPIEYRHLVPSIGFTIEVRINVSRISGSCQLFYAAYMSARTFQEGVIRHTGRGTNAYSDFELFRQISAEAFNIAANLGVSDAHIWPLLEKFPEFTDSGVKISDLSDFEGPIRDLLARGAAPQEVISSLGISRTLYEFVTHENLPPEPVAADPMAVDDPDW